MVVDLEALDYADGSTISALLAAADRLPPEGELRLVNPNPNVGRLLKLTGLMSPSWRCFPLPIASDKAGCGTVWA